MNTAADWIKHHQVAAFFIITFAITWGLGFSYDAVINRGQFWLAPLVMIATCGPALAGILVTSISNPSPKGRQVGHTGSLCSLPWLYRRLSCWRITH